MRSSSLNLVIAHHYGYELVALKITTVWDNCLHERCLRLLYNEKQSSSLELLERNDSVSIHQPNLRFLAIEILNKIEGNAPTLVEKMFHLNKTGTT